MERQEETAAERLYLVRLSGEVTIKSRRTRGHFVRRLVGNIRDALESGGVDGTVERRWGRLYVRTAAPAGALLERVFGVSSVSPVERVTAAELGEIVAAGAEAFTERVRGKTFAVRARRAGEHDFSSQDVEVRLGTALDAYADHVDLDEPEVTVRVEVRDERAYLFAERLAGARGLPLGVEGRAVALVSGGYDSAVAAWLGQKRGIGLDYIFCNLGGEAYERAVVRVMKVLADGWSFGTRPRLQVVDFGAPVEQMRERVRQSYWQVVLKRLMYRAGSLVGAELGADAFVTGESVGQVSSQTLKNLRAIEPAASLPVLRPLVGFDKDEIIERARAIGTAGLSERVKEYCALAPGKPVTAAKPEAVDAQAAKLDPAVLDEAVASRKTLDLRALTPTDLVAPYLFTSEIPGDAVVFDCRPEQQYRAWHLPGAERREEWDLLRGFERLDRDRTYVLYCAQGAQTAYLAEKMQDAGYEAYSFEGGVRGVMRYAEEERVAAR